ncbi:MAG: hypothetical protein Q9191_002629 [Dirinaria sp. TL-2023a]
MRWAKNEPKINRLLSRIRSSQSSLNMILAIFTCTSTDEVRRAVESLAATVENIRATCEDVSQRLAFIESNPSGINQSAMREIDSLPYADADYASLSQGELMDELETLEVPNFSIPHRGQQRPHPALTSWSSGTLAAGKSTILKQMRMTYAFSLITSRERDDARQLLLETTASAIRDIIVEKYDEASKINSIKVESFISELHDPITAFANLDKETLDEHRLLKDDYAANNDDFLRAYAKTTGVSETYLTSHRLGYRVFDVSGSAAERKRKWNIAAVDVDCVIFIVSLAGYDRHCDSDSSIRDALAVFESLITRGDWLRKATIVLLLNKTDIFREKIKQVSVREHWPDFNGPEGDYDAALKFFTEKFCSLQRKEDSRNVYVYCANLTNTEDSEAVLNSIEALMVSRSSCTS